LEPKASIFDVIQRRKRITVFNLGKLMRIKALLDYKETFKALAENYNEAKFRFEFKTFRERNKAPKGDGLGGCYFSHFRYFNAATKTFTREIL
jgi:hypothetical protein